VDLSDGLSRGSTSIFISLGELRGMSRSVGRPNGVWRADCPESRGVGMRKSSGLAGIVAPRRQVRELRSRPPEFCSLSVSHLRTCVSICCGVVLFSIVTGKFAASRLVTPWRSYRCTVHVPGPGQSFPTEPPRQTINASLAPVICEIPCFDVAGSDLWCTRGASTGF
jgi:hypothetical protein